MLTMIKLVESYGMENCENQIFISQSEQEALFFWLAATLTSVNKTAITFTFDHFSHHLLQPGSHCWTIQKKKISCFEKQVKNLDNRTSIYFFAFFHLQPLEVWFLWTFDGILIDDEDQLSYCFFTVTLLLLLVSF